MYLRFSNRLKDFELRATSDIDLIVTETQAKKKANRFAILKAIKGDLQYCVCSDAKHFMFEKPPASKLDILVPPLRDDDIETDGFRVKLVKSQLHGYLTPEACFIEEGLEKIAVNDYFVNVPSISNLLILKLLAFDDRHKRQDTERAQTHAFDVFVMAELSDTADYRQSREFISIHNESEIINKTRLSISENFKDIESSGWEYVLRTGVFPQLSPQQKHQRLKHAANRLLRWFEC
ncbi:MAG: hypothetical protein WC374_11910 [Phycisphaerae bacterium]